MIKWSEKMVLIDMFSAGLPQNFINFEICYSWNVIKQSTIKWGITDCKWNKRLFFYYFLKFFLLLISFNTYMTVSSKWECTVFWNLHIKWTFGNVILKELLSHLSNSLQPHAYVLPGHSVVSDSSHPTWTVVCRVPLEFFWCRNDFGGCHFSWEFFPN